MPLYVIIAPKDPAPSVDSLFPEQERCSIMPGVWLVRNEKANVGEVARDLEDEGNPKLNYIVVSSSKFSGFAESRIVDFLSTWEIEDA